MVFQNSTQALNEASAYTLRSLKFFEINNYTFSLALQSVSPTTPLVCPKSEVFRDFYFVPCSQKGLWIDGGERRSNEVTMIGAADLGDPVSHVARDKNRQLPGACLGYM